ncbi:hypothetical protein G0Q06_00915 [Puniceicoccales bacterium CK1056]|uniref:Uncharacterized protein n=1 Tax=Oceanipulchritudo coccoides TaxID=2706888 RepID=A0A6B2LXK1_9BACT|nr:hypothetical protein [Oceanipulchritudo coccoides]NDV61003.1 hypothetical protein [Oceanipulchritudo coccoides]
MKKVISGITGCVLIAAASWGMNTLSDDSTHYFRGMTAELTEPNGLGERFLHFTVTLVETAEALSYRVERSPDMIAWVDKNPETLESLTEIISVTSVAAGLDKITVHDSEPINTDSPSRFFRMVAEASPGAILLSDGAGLSLSMEEDGGVQAVSLSENALPIGGTGGFYLCEPADKGNRVPLVGKTVVINDQVYFTATPALQATVRAVFTQGDGFIEVRGELEDLTGEDRGLWLGFNVPVNTVGWKWGQTLSTSPVITSQDTGYESSWDNSLVPIPAVWTTNGGIALCIPPSDPCVFQLASDADGLRIQMAYGLSGDTTKFPSKASFRFRIYSIDGTWGFRDALAKYYDWYPEYYTIDSAAMSAMDHHHDWLGVNYVPDSIKVDDLVDPDSKEYMGYTKTSARIQGLSNAAQVIAQQGYLGAIAIAPTIQHYEKNGAPNSPLLVEGRAALINSVAYKSDGTFGDFGVYDTDGIDFPHNCDPDLFKDAAHPDYPVYADMYLRKAEEIQTLFPDFASIHWDRLGGWSLFLNYRREHFAYIDHPLTFDQNGQVCIYTQLTNYEMFDEFRLRASQGGLFHEAAGMKDYGAGKIQDNPPAGQSRNGMFFLAAVVAGGWQEGSFKAQELGGFDFERMSVGRKSYRVSSGNIVARREAPTLALVKRALAQTTAYGFACPVQVQYFFSEDRPGYLPNYSWYNLPDHKALWDQYEPANLAIRLAGWEPVTHAWVNSSAVQLQRFGRGDEIYLTVWGPTPPASVEIEIDAAALGLKSNPIFEEIVSGVAMTVTPSPKGWKLTVPLETNMTRVIRIR